MGSAVGKYCLAYCSISYQLYIGVNMFLNTDARLHYGKPSMAKATLATEMEVLAQEDALSVISSLQDSAMCLRCTKRKAHRLDT